MKIKIRDVGRLFGHDLPKSGGRSKCPLQKHRRDDKTFRVYEAKDSGDELFKCWSCDDPDNTGDAVKLYALLAHVDNGEAFKRLKEMGYALGNPSYEPSRPKLPVPARGSSRPEEMISLDEAILARFRKDPASDTLVDRFARERHLAPEVARAHMVGMPRQFYWLERPEGVGFVYVDPVTNIPCRIKARSVIGKHFQILPKGEKDSGQRAKAPLFLAEHLKTVPRPGAMSVVLVTEGEVDALSLLSVGIRSVVSLPDGCDSADTADILPLLPFSTWLCAFDDDDPGKKAVRTIRARAKRYGNDVVSILWSRTKLDGSSVAYKDTNDALKDGMGRDEFIAVVDRKLEAQYGCPIPWIRAA